MNKPSGESQRPNSTANRTYGTSHSNITTYDRVDVDEVYDLLDDAAMDPSHHHDNLNKGVLILDDYSTPSDVITGKQDGAMTVYSTTYDDPIRKQSDHGSAIKLNIGLNGDAVINPDSDIELKQYRQVPPLPELAEKDSSENESRKGQFKGCLCAMNASAESDMENPEQLPNTHQNTEDGAGDISCVIHIDNQPDANTVKDNASNGTKIPNSYYKLTPHTLSEEIVDVDGQTGSTKEHSTASEAAETIVGLKANTSASNAEDTFKHKVIMCLEDKGNKEQADDDSDYEDTSIVDAKDDSDYEDTTVVNASEGKSRHVTMPMHCDAICLHSPPEILMERLGIRLVPDTSTYETYMALPKSRADLMNPYYTSYHQHATQHQCHQIASISGDTGAASRDEPCEYDVTMTSQSKRATANRQCITDNEYDRLFNTRRNLQPQNSNHSNNTYDTILSSLGKRDGRKRLNSY